MGREPPPPPGFTFAASHCIGDSSTTSRTCLAAPQQTKLGRDCGGDCFTVASKACLADDTCSAFAYTSNGKMYETYSVGLANVVANSDWMTYAKPMLCCQCPDSGAFIAATAKDVQSFTTGLHHWSGAGARPSTAHLPGL
jgi:hypothetical protein